MTAAEETFRHFRNCRRSCLRIHPGGQSEGKAVVIRVRVRDHDPLERIVSRGEATDRVSGKGSGDRRQRGGGGGFVVEPGAMVREQQPIVRLPDASYMQVKAKVNESRVTLVRKSLPVVITCEALSGETLSGEVTRVNQYAEPTTGWGSPIKVYTTLIKIIDPPEAIRTGLTAQVSIQVDRRENVVQIPIQGVVEHGGKTYCIVMEKENRYAKDFPTR